MDSKSLTIAISTYSTRVIDIGSFILPQNARVNYMIIHQGHSNIDVSSIDFLARSDVSYFPVDSVGVAASRNFALDRSDSDFLYFCDDDVILDFNLPDILFSAFEQFSAPILTFNVKVHNGGLKKSFPTKACSRSFLNILNVGTIEMAVRLPILNSRFPEDMGAGSSLPVGDEAVFLASCLRSGYKITHIPITIVSHPPVSSGANNSLIFFRARGVTIRRVFGLYLGFFVVPIYAFKHFKKFNKFDCLFEYIKGFFKA